MHRAAFDTEFDAPVLGVVADLFQGRRQMLARGGDIHAAEGAAGEDPDHWRADVARQVDGGLEIVDAGSPFLRRLLGKMQAGA
jgi:hypothetical protein